MSIKLYPYQEKVGALLQSGKSVILQAPTGAGKTLAALHPFFEAEKQAESGFPRKCIYTVPMRVLANQFLATYQEYAPEKKGKITIQTGEHAEDKQFSGDLIFCTIDQFLASYLHMPYGLPRRLANTNAGAFVGAYLVFDEFHLLDPDSTLPTALHAIHHFSQVAPVLLMTATFSATLLSELQKQIHNCEVVLVEQDESRQIESDFGKRSNRQRVWQLAEAPLSAQAVWDNHKKRSLAICNTVRGAQTLFRELKTLAQGSEVELVMLHSRFLPEDRQKIEQEIRTRFSRGNTAGSLIAIATQTIEVGVDITSKIIHTELAPASALIQRAGRCARYPGEQGQVIVYPVETLRPYGSESENSLWGQEMKMALDWLQNHQGEAFDFGKEQEFINAVATARDKKILDNVSAGRAQREAEILKALQGEQNGMAARELIRDADSKLVLIHPEPDALSENPLLAKGFNIPTNTLRGMVKDWLTREADVDWRVKRLIEDDGDGENYQTEYGWQRLGDVSEVGVARALVVNPELAGYVADEGFRSELGNTDFVSTMGEEPQKTSFESFSYHTETYEKHIERVLEAFRDYSLTGFENAARRLEKAAGWSAGSVNRAAWLALLFHDVGKLSQGWQGWARAYQKEIGLPVSLKDALGHTEFDRRNPEHVSAEKYTRQKNPKPPHAAESALAVAPILARAFPKEEKLLAKATLTAITRHHASFTRECKTYRLEGLAANHLSATLNFAPLEVRQSVNLELLKTEANVKPNDFPNLLISPENVFGWLAYTLIARALRQADQKGTQKGTQS